MVAMLMAALKSDIGERTAGTSPVKIDTDGDGVDDKTEMTQGTDPTKANSNNKVLGATMRIILDLLLE